MYLPNGQYQPQMSEAQKEWLRGLPERSRQNARRLQEEAEKIRQEFENRFPQSLKEEVLS